jgi:hypothetical protein
VLLFALQAAVYVPQPLHKKRGVRHGRDPVNERRLDRAAKAASSGHTFEAASQALP